MSFLASSNLPTTALRYFFPRVKSTIFQVQICLECILLVFESSLHRFFLRIKDSLHRTSEYHCLNTKETYFRSPSKTKFFK